MRKKLDRLLRFKTQNFTLEKQNTTRHHTRISGALSIKKFDQKKQLMSQRQPFIEKSHNITMSILKSSSKRLKTYVSKIGDETLNKSIKFDKDLKLSRKKIIKIGQKQVLMQILIKEVQFYKKTQQRTIDLMKNICWICQQIIEQVYSYNKVQMFIKNLNAILKQIGSKSIIVLGYCLSSQCFYDYGSYSLSIYYADKALKLLGEKQNKSKYQRQKQTDLYQTIAKIFLTKNEFQTAKQFGYKYLRKAWYLKNYQKQVDAYDLLGKIYHEIQQKSMSIYFHNRMCKGQRQDLQIIRISNYELQKQQKQKLQYAVYESIQIFVLGDKIFHQMLQDRYRMKNKNFEIGQIFQQTNQFFFHTHRSPNRNLNTYRILERKMIQQKRSKQLHFIKPKQKGNLKKIVTQFSKLIKQLKEEFQSHIQNYSQNTQLMQTK